MGFAPQILGVRIDIDALPASERLVATRATTVVRQALRTVAHGVNRVRLRREHSRWVAEVALAGGVCFEVEQATPADDEGALDHFADRIARAVARRLTHPKAGQR
jgi:hypothetical protein